MASVNGVNRAKAIDPSSDNVLDRGVLGGKLRVMYDYYEAASTATGTTIKVGQDLNDGDRIIDIWLMTDALGNGVTLAVGDSDTAGRYISATACNTANQRLDLDTIAGLNYEIGTNDGDNTILITLAGTASGTGTIKIVVLYSRD